MRLCVWQEVDGWSSKVMDSMRALIQLERVCVVINHVGYMIGICMSQVGAMLGMRPVGAMVVQEARISHSSRLIGYVSAIVPVWSKGRLVIGNRGSHWSLRWTHGSVEGMAVDWVL